MKARLGARPATAIVVAAAAAVLALGGCGGADEQAGQRTSAVASGSTRAPAEETASRPVDLRTAVGQQVRVTTTVQEVLHANAFVVVDGDVGPEPVLVTTGAMPRGMDRGASVVVVGRVLNDPPGSDPVMNEYKARGPIIEAADVRLA